MDLFNDYGAKFSDCRKYRYALWRIWDTSKPLIMFIGLNPSTANENDDDPTIRRVKKFAFDWGYGGVYMMNLFAYVTPYPDALLKVYDPLGDNDFWLQSIGSKVNDIVFAWGGFDLSVQREADVIKMFPNAKALVINKDGTPRHPLYVKANTIPVKFNQLQNVFN